MSEKVCSHHKSKRRKAVRRCCAGVLVLAFLVLLVTLLVWAILQPKKPRFVLQDATVFSLNVTAPNVISTNLQVTVVSRNPNRRIGIYYDRLSIYGNYHNQQITFFTSIPTVYQGHRDVNVWSPFIYGNNVPVAPYNGASLRQDQSNGLVQMTVKINGRVKWRVGSFVSGRYHLHVSCPVIISIGNGKSLGINAVKYQLSQSCSRTSRQGRKGSFKYDPEGYPIDSMSEDGAHGAHSHCRMGKVTFITKVDGHANLQSMPCIVAGRASGAARYQSAGAKTALKRLKSRALIDITRGSIVSFAYMSERPPSLKNPFP